MSEGNWGGARVGAGRKAKEPGRPRKALSVSVSASTWEAVKAHAEAAGLTTSEAADQLLAAGAAALGIGALERVVPRAGVEIEVKEVSS